MDTGILSDDAPGGKRGDLARNGEAAKRRKTTGPKLDRTTFRTSREMDFFSEKELKTISREESAMPKDEYLTPEQVIAWLQLDHDGCDREVARERLRNRCRSRQIPFIRLGRLIRFRTSDIEQVLEKNSIAAL